MNCHRQRTDHFIGILKRITNRLLYNNYLPKTFIYSFLTKTKQVFLIPIFIRVCS